MLDWIGLEGRVGRYAAAVGPKTANTPKRLTLVGFILVPPRHPRRPIDNPYCGCGPLMPAIGAGPVRWTILDLEVSESHPTPVAQVTVSNVRRYCTMHYA